MKHMPQVRLSERSESVDEVEPVSFPEGGQVLEYTVSTVTEWEGLLEMPVADCPKDGIVQIDDEILVSDGSYGERREAVHGVYQKQHEVLGEFQIRRASGVVCSLSEGRKSSPWLVSQAFDSVSSYGNNECRQEMWSLPLEYGVKALVSETISDGGSSGGWSSEQYWIDISELEYSDVSDCLVYRAVLDIEGFDSVVYWDCEGVLWFDESDVSRLDDVIRVVEKVEDRMRVERRNDCRVL